VPLFIDYHEEKVVWSARYKDDEMGPLMKQVINDIRAGVVDDAGVRCINILILQDGHGACITEAPSADAVLKSHEQRGMPITLGEIHPIAHSLTKVVSIDNTRESTMAPPYTRGDE
jgi:hypothetical protein